MLRNTFLTTMILFSLLSCQSEKPERYTKDCAEIDLLRKGIEYYENGEWEKWEAQYSDSAKIYQNTWLAHTSPAQTRKRNEVLLSNFSSYGFERENLSMERIINDNGKTWVNSWGLWRGTWKHNGEVIEIPVHLTIQFVDGKIVEEIGLWDTAQLKETLKVWRFQKEHYTDLREVPVINTDQLLLDSIIKIMKN